MLLQGPIAPYVQLSTLFRRRIEYGEWAVGQQIPTLAELSREFGVAHQTLRRALADLIGEGLLEARRAKGTFVLKSGSAGLWREIEIGSEGALQPRRGASIKLLERREGVSPPISSHPGSYAPSYLYMRRLYSRDRQAFMLAKLYIASDLAKHFKPSDLASKLGGRMAELAPAGTICGLRQTITILAADLEVSRQLNIPLNSPIAQIDRTRYGPDGQKVVISTGLYRGDVVRMDFSGGKTPK